MSVRLEHGVARAVLEPPLEKSARMTDPSPIAPADGLPEPGPAARQPTRSTSEIVTRFVAANFTDALPYILVPVLFILSVIFIPGYFSKLSIISLLILAALLGLASLGQTITIIAGGIGLSQFRR